MRHAHIIFRLHFSTHNTSTLQFGSVSVPTTCQPSSSALFQYPQHIDPPVRLCFSTHNTSTLQFGSAADLRSGEPREWAYTARANGDYRYYERRHFPGATDSYLDEFTNLDKTVYGRLCPPRRPGQSWWLPFSQVNIR